MNNLYLAILVKRFWAAGRLYSNIIKGRRISNNLPNICESDLKQIIHYLDNNIKYIVLYYASENGYSTVVELLLKVKDVYVHINNSICIATHNGYFDVVKLLLSYPHVTCDNEAIHLACIYGHESIVRILLSDPRIDPSSRNNYAIRLASRYRQ